MSQSRFITFSDVNSHSVTFYAPDVPSAALLEPGVVDPVKWGVSFGFSLQNVQPTALFNTQAEAQALIDDWKAKKV